jgi:O-antigen/teichoic acid export membrane protein
MTAARYFRPQMYLFAVIVATAALACLWLIPSSGLYGAATAVIIASVVRAGGSLAIVMYVLRALGHVAKDEHS